MSRLHAEGKHIPQEIYEKLDNKKTIRIKVHDCKQ